MRRGLLVAALLGALGCGGRVPASDDEATAATESSPSSAEATTTSEGAEAEAESEAESEASVGSDAESSESGEVCVPGESEPCISPSGCSPADRFCTEDGQWGSCDCIFLPQPADCQADEQCSSGFCFDLGLLGSYCGECVDDADCPDGTCQTPGALGDLVSTCAAGELGDGCQTSGCKGATVCATYFVPDPSLVYRACSECRVDADCDLGTVCGIALDPLSMAGHRHCVPVGSVALDGACDAGSASGGDVCASGICGATPAGTAVFGFCSECSETQPCPTGLSCTPGVVDFIGEVYRGRRCE